MSKSNKMKNLSLLLTLFLSTICFSQKTLEIYNFSTRTITISIIKTKPATGIYLWYGSTIPLSIEILSGGQYILENSTNIYRFPFYSPSSTPEITQWRKVVQSTNGNASFSPVSSNVAWTLGNDQFFNYLSFSVNNGSEDGGNIGEPSGSITSNTQNNWEVSYDNFTSGTTIFNTIVYYDI